MNKKKPNWDFDEFAIELGKSTTQTAVTEVAKDVASHILGATLNKVSEAALKATVGWMVGPLLEVLFHRSKALEKELKNLEKRVEELEHEVFFGPLLRGQRIAYRTLIRISKESRITSVDLQNMRHALYELQTAEEQMIAPKENSERKLCIYLLQAVCAIWSPDTKEFARDRLKQCNTLIKILLEQAKCDIKNLVDLHHEYYKQLKKYRKSYVMLPPGLIGPSLPYSPIANSHHMPWPPSEDSRLKAKSLNRKIDCFDALRETVEKLLIVASTKS